MCLQNFARMHRRRYIKYEYVNQHKNETGKVNSEQKSTFLPPSLLPNCRNILSSGDLCTVFNFLNIGDRLQLRSKVLVFLFIAEKKREERTTSVGSSATSASTSAQGGLLTPTSKLEDAIPGSSVTTTGTTTAAAATVAGKTTENGTTTTACVGVTTAVAVSAAAGVDPTVAAAAPAPVKQTMSMPSASIAAGGWVSIARASIEKSSSLLSDRVSKVVPGSSSGNTVVTRDTAGQSSKKLLLK